MWMVIIKHILKALELNLFQKKENKNIITDSYRMQAENSIMCGYFCTGFIDFILKGKSLIDYKNLFSPNQYRKNDKIILKYFQ